MRTSMLKFAYEVYRAGAPTDDGSLTLDKLLASGDTTHVIVGYGMQKTILPEKYARVIRAKLGFDGGRRGPRIFSGTFTNSKKKHPYTLPETNFMRRLGAVFVVDSDSIRFLCILYRFTAEGHLPQQTGNWSVGACTDDQGNTQNHSWWGHQDRVCELRTTTIKLGGAWLGAKSENGGIEVTGEDRSDVQIEARVEGLGGSESDARNILKQIVINTSGDRIRDEASHSLWGNSGYSVNYRSCGSRVKLAVDLNSYEWRHRNRPS